MRILLILASDLIYKYKNIFSINNGFAPLSLTLLSASVPEKYEAEIRIIDEGMQKVNYDHLNYDIVGISCCASSSNRAYELAKYWNKRGAYTIIGGYHATLCPDEVIKHCDTVMCGFGENMFPTILEDYINGSTKKIYKSKCGDINCTIKPNRNLIKHIPYYAKNTIFATRGCINNCSYCSVNKFSNSKYFKRPINEIINEIKSENFKKVYFLDSNFVADREYTKELLTALIPLKIKYYADITSNIYNDDEIISLLNKSGCYQVFIGFETFNLQNSNSSSKFNTIKNYKNCVNILHDNNIAITGGFMLGMENDNVESIMTLPQKIDDLGVDLIRYTIFTPLPGTSIFDKYKLEKKLLTTNYDYYDFMHVVHKTKFVAPEILQKLYFGIWEKTYSYKNIIKRVSRIKQQKTDLLLQNLYFKHLGNKIPKIIPFKY